MKYIIIGFTRRTGKSSIDSVDKVPSPRYLLVDSCAQFNLVMSGYVITFINRLLLLKIIQGRRFCDKIRT